MTDILELEEFFVEGGDQQKSHVLLHISEPSTPEEKQKGYFFALTDLAQADYGQITELQDLIDAVESAYYGATDDLDSDAFESALAMANRRGHRVLQSPHTEMNCLIGVLQGMAVNFAYHGKPEAALLCQRNGEYSYTGIIGESDEDGKSSQLFSSLMQGSMKSGDYLYLATPHVREFFPSDRIQKLIAGRTAKETVGHMEKVLGALRNGRSYGGILFHILPKQAAPKTGKQPRYLEPAHPPQEKPASASETETNYRPRTDRAASIGLPTIILTGLARSILGLFQIFKRCVLGCVRWCIKLLIIATNLGGQRATALADIARAYDRQRKAWVAFPLISKLLLGLAGLCAVFFAGSAGYLRYKKQADIKQQHTMELVAAIRHKRDAAEASSIYGDGDKALALLQEAQGLLNQLPNNSSDRRTLTSELANQMDRLQTTLRKWAVVGSNLLVDLSKTVAHPQAERLVSSNNGLIAYGPHDSAIYRIHINTKKVEVVTHATISSLTAGNTPKEDDRVVFVSGPKAVAEYDRQSGTFAPKDISFPKSEVALSDLFVYNQKLFTLDPATKQIYKHAKTQTGYDRGVPWIKNPAADLGSAVSMAIDGDIFVLTSEGKILLFTAGATKTFSTKIDPPLDKPIAIWTYNNVQNLYILEPIHKRIVVLDKNGTLLHQYSDPQWVNPTGMVVDEAKKTIFVLDNNKIYRLAIQ